MIGFDIVIVNWNTGSKLRECSQSILLACQAPDIRLNRCVVVDNASSDGSANALEDLPLPLEMIKNGSNKGFAYACNQGAKAGNAKYILFLNPDCRLFPDSLQKALLFLEEKQNKNVGILGIQLIDENGIVQRNTARFPTPISLVTQMLGFDHLWPQRFPPHFIIEWKHLENREVDQVEGAFFFVRRGLFEKLKGFDEQFFMYFEELDFAYRAKQAGWQSFYLADAKALHYGGRSSYQIKARRLYYVLCSRVLYVAKHFGALTAACILFFSVVVEFWTRLGWSILKPSEHSPKDTIRAYGMLLKSTPQLIKKLGNR
ncbi:MAG: glycosyltransferase family 2 protein [Anaerolineales bacterium]|jgi:GT2 family glycosyltransferase